MFKETPFSLRYNALEMARGILQAGFESEYEAWLVIMGKVGEGKAILHIEAGGAEWQPTEAELAELTTMFAEAGSDPVGSVVATNSNVKATYVFPVAPKPPTVEEVIAEAQKLSTFINTDPSKS